MKILCLTPVQHIKGVYDILDKCGEVFYYPDVDAELARRAVHEVQPEAIFVNPNKMKFRLDKTLLCPSVRFVCTASTGLNHIDIDYCNSKNIKVLSLTTDYDVIERITSTAEHAFALMMSLIRHIPRSFNDVTRHGYWDYEPFIGRQLNHLTAGVIGYGRLGKMFANYCWSFGMRVLVYDPYVSRCAKVDSLKEIMETCDVISLHVHLKEDTHHMINADSLKHIKPTGAYLVNTSRGDIVNESDVIDALDNGVLLGYATDVISNELGGSIYNSMLVRASEDMNIIVTPHIGGMTTEAQEIAYTAAADKLFLEVNEKERDRK